ncbi:flagellin [Thalassospiraceae bacterium SW-3-3]|nr:flagellin [Thalassospiraceae bacterium SW-3-3]
MALNIISNYAANVAHRNLSASDEMATRSLAKLSSGTRVVTARDDAASMAIGARLNAEVQSLKTATVNVGQANSMLQIADGGMATIDTVLTRMKTLAVQSASGNLSDTERGFLDDEFQQLIGEIDRISQATTFNGRQLLTGGFNNSIDAPTATATAIQAAGGFTSFKISDDSTIGTTTVNVDFIDASNIMTLTDETTGQSQSIDLTAAIALATGTETAEVSFNDLGITVTINANLDGGGDIVAGDATTQLDVTQATSTNLTVDYQIGSQNTANDRLSITLQAVSATALGLAGDVATSGAAQTAIDTVGAAIDSLQEARSNVGVQQNRLDFAASNLKTATENNEAARSVLLDLDVASEMTNFTSKQILVQSGVAMLAQANQMPQNLLRLLQ